jgi:MFS family permease
MPVEKGKSRLFYGWYMVMAGMGIHLWISIGWVYAKQIFFTPIATSFGWSRALMSGAFALERLEGSIASPIEGLLVDRYGPKRIMLFGTFICGLGIISLAFLQNIYMFYLSVLLVALGQSMMMGIPRTWALVQWFRRLRGRALGIGGSGAILSGPLVIITVLLVDSLGWRSAFLVLGITTWCINGPLCLVFRNKPEEYGYLPDGDAPEDPNQDQSQSAAASKKRADVEGSLTVKQALKTPAFWMLSLVFGAQTMGANAMNIHLIPYFESINFTTSEAVSVLGMFTLLSAIGRLGGGWAFDFFNKRMVLAFILACEGIAFIIMVNVSVYWQVVPFALFWGIAFGGMIPARGVILSAYFGTESFGSITGLAQAASVFAGMLGPILLGAIFDITGSYIPGIWILAIVAFAAIPLIFMAKQPKLTP